MSFTDRETAVLNRIQRDMPIVENPFELLSSELNQSEAGVLSIVERLKDKGIIRNISCIFNAESLGYRISLVAFEVPEEYIDRAAEVINSHPGVSHNYLRDHRYNIWFTLAVEPESSLENTVSILERGSHAVDCLILKNERILKIGLMLDVGNSFSVNNPERSHKKKHRVAEPRDFTDEERESIRLLQHDLPIEKRPFKSIIERSESFLGEKELIELGQSLKGEGVIRRYSAVLRHRNAGFTANAMTVWKPDESKDFDRMADIFIDEPSISHLYLRTVYPGRWEYPLFAMIHSRSGDALQGIVDRLVRESGISEYAVLTTLREFKKKRVSYFSEEFQDWRERNYL